MDTPANNDGDKRLRARLALTGEAEITNWQEKEQYLEKRKIEAAKAMASDEQKKIREEAEKAQQRKEEAQKKLAELELVKKAEEEKKNKDISAVQREKDLAQEKLRQAKIKEILESQRTIEGIKRSPQSSLSSIHTLTDDLSEEIKDKGFTASRLVQANRKEKKEEEKTFSWRKTAILTFSIILFLGGVTALTWSLWQREQKSKEPAKVTHDSLVFADEHLAIDLKGKTPEQIKQEIKNLAAKDSSSETTREKIKDIYFVYEEQRKTKEGMVIDKKIAGPELFATSTGLHITNDLLRFLEPDFMLGIYEGVQTQVFYLFKTTAYKNSADALLRNENEIVSQLLLNFVEKEVATKIQTTPFQDKMVLNRDVRIVIDQDNQIIALYTWFDKNTIVVTTNETTMEKVLNSFLTPKPVIK